MLVDCPSPSTPGCRRRQLLGGRLVRARYAVVMSDTETAAWAALLRVHAAVVPVLDRTLQTVGGLPLTWSDVLLELRRFFQDYKALEGKKSEVEELYDRKRAHEVIRESLATTPAPVVAVSPLVAGAVVKGPTEPFLRWAGQPLSSTGIAVLYEGVIGGLVADEDTEAIPVRVTDVLMADAASRRRVAEETLSFATSLGR